MLPTLAFYALSGIAVAAAFMVVAARNPVHSVMYLITTFFSAAGLFVLMGAEFLALLLVMVYVGAVAVLFLFVVMMLDVDFVEMKQGFLQYLPIGAVVALILLAEMILVGAASLANPDQTVVFTGDKISNMEALGNVLYTEYAFFFEAVGLILLVAMIGAIVLTLRSRDNVKRQNVFDQVTRTREEGVEMVDIQPGEGLGS
ncbi:MAG TPA: NADH-quinone oxidoreductase subunit J [Hellea balneolensis]|uniref:NADH-quinone oxidoreductase subunit J n=1 Tax=Hellea balneolensis TaxID=287478 RepID=A0A7C3C547_9PROT|nr:NADH-quinone oxidoreductase subunit J [Hellea balneolensis]